MNILLFSMTILMLLAAMTYAKLDSFRSMQLSKTEFENYLKKNENVYLAKKANDWYDKVIVKSQSQPNKAKKKGNTGNAKLSFHPILDIKQREKDPSKAKEILEITKNLILHLFENQPNVQKMLETSPDIIDRLLKALLTALDKMQEGSKIKKIDDLSSLELQDEDLKNLRYEIFKKNDLPKKENLKELDVKNKKIEKTTYSLLDELTATSGKTRLFLASKNLLKVIFKNEATADQIIEKRNFLFNAVKNKMDPKEASTEFQDFLNGLCPYLNDSLFDYTVTQTNPKDYE